MNVRFGFFYVVEVVLFENKLRNEHSFVSFSICIDVMSPILTASAAVLPTGAAVTSDTFTPARVPQMNSSSSLTGSSGGPFIGS